MAWLAGQGVGLIREIHSAGEIVEDMMSEGGAVPLRLARASSSSAIPSRSVPTAQSRADYRDLRPRRSAVRGVRRGGASVSCWSRARERRLHDSAASGTLPTALPTTGNASRRQRRWPAPLLHRRPTERPGPTIPVRAMQQRSRRHCARR